ncbi:phosphoribosyl-ATP pyrophosphohydrolase [Peptacetobacter hominis]|uniref:Phosphoribosyl-ATP pyrophosphohydrolase n=1 Tax=Peptacetobacter hominis TaxID=2743610 RepID=A0A544QTQ0_9FIRM|nr:nucleoside triphosphate pyrophosphohydrolase [Peptacetobacter hominis]TQQ84068.1 phosphoribosyl-ATP pyrophosphohydrolase [Peptacetobacter hominis]
MIEYDKLVRDNIPQIIESGGTKCEFETVDDFSALEYLYDKLREESQELIDCKNVDEACDVLEVVFAIASKYGYTEEELLARREERKSVRGGFEKNIVLKKVL